MSTRRFQPTLWGTAAAIAGIALMVSLGLWQLDRARQKEALAARQEQLAREPPIRLEHAISSMQALEHRQVLAYGHFEPQAMIWLDNRVRGGVVGYEVVMPLRITATAARVLVNRGWIAGTRDRARLPELATPTEEVRVSGRAVIPGKRVFELGGEQASGRVWQNLTIERYRERLGIDVLPFMIEQTNDAEDGLQRIWPAPDRGAGVNRSYAVQWFALAVLIALAYLIVCFRRDTANN